MTEVIVFSLKSGAKAGQIDFTAPGGTIYGGHTSISSAMKDISRDYPLETVINFKWVQSETVSFKDETVEAWMRLTFRARGKKPDDLEAEIQSLRNLHESQWA